ncbi:unnamed protein product, partial [Echinostoma caproni]|uniref:C2H2-type domain-containing protein n=1 Tax=Echinostoma caproni TaxID=27848 RepID=A0A183B941_9TREM
MLYQCSKCHKISSSKTFLAEHLDLYHHPSHSHPCQSHPRLHPHQPPHAHRRRKRSSSNNAGDSGSEAVSPILENGHTGSRDSEPSDEDDELEVNEVISGEKTDSPTHRSPKSERHMVAIPDSDDSTELGRKHGRVTKAAEVTTAAYAKTLFVGQLCGQSSAADQTDSVTSNNGPNVTLGIQHQCLFCAYTTPNTG